MKKLALFICALSLSGVAIAQDKQILNYNGHWYIPGDNTLDEEALRFQQLLKEKSSFDTLSKGIDKYVTREQFARVLEDLNQLAKSEAMLPSNGALITQLADYAEMVRVLKFVLQSNDNYRRQAATATNRIITARRDGWSNDLYSYVIRESAATLLKYLYAQSPTDKTLQLALGELSLDERYKNCRYGIAVDTRMMDDPDMQMFVCDRMEYILGADIYRYRETTPGVVTDYAKRKKESADLMGWLLQRATTDKSQFVVPVSYSHNPGNKPNEAAITLQQNTDWYVFLFYKGVLYYSDALPKCDHNAGMISILYKP